MPSISETLAQNIYDMSFDDLPDEVKEEAKLRILDIIAVTVPAWDLEEPARIAGEYVNRFGGAEEATVMTAGFRVPAHMAAFANGVAGHCLELDDDHNTMVGHPGVPTVPAVLATGERVHADGKALMLATVIAYDVVIRTAQAIDAGVMQTLGFHRTGTNGTFGAVAGAAKVLGLNPEQIAHAFGITGSQSAGSLQGTDEGVWTKRFNPGWAAHNGVTAATMAEMGFTGPQEIFEGKRGWYNAYPNKGYNLDKILAEWGTRFEIINTAWKPYACNRYSHPSIDCAFAIRREMGGAVDPEAIERIEVLVPKDYLPFVAEPYEVKVRPRNTVDSQFSSYYAVSVALLTGKALLDEFSDEKIKDPEVLGLAAKTEIRADAEVQKLYPQLYPSRLIVTMKDGTTYDHMVETAKGDPEWDLTQEELEERFRTLAGRVFDEERVEHVLDTVLHLEDVDDAADLMQLCVR